MHKIISEDINKILSFELDWEKFDGKNILVTGASGLLPSYIVFTLLELNKKLKNKCSIFALVRNLDNAKKKFNEYLECENLKFICQNVCDKIDIDENINFVIHAASQASPKYYGVDPVGTLESNIIGTKNILELAKIKNSESVLFFSSGEVYGEVESKNIPTKENDYGYLDPISLRSCYAESKRMGENMCVSWYHQHQIPVKIVRPFHTYGPGIELDDGRIYSDFIKNILDGENLLIKSDGLATRAFCYLADATLGFFKVLLDGKNGEAYNIGNPRCEISIVELANLLIKVFPEKRLSITKNLAISDTTKNYLKSEISRNSPNIDKVKNLGWEPTVSLEEGFKRTILSYE